MIDRFGAEDRDVIEEKLKIIPELFDQGKLFSEAVEIISNNVMYGIGRKQDLRNHFQKSHEVPGSPSIWNTSN